MSRMTCSSRTGLNPCAWVPTWYWRFRNTVVWTVETVATGPELNFWSECVWP